MDLNTVSEIVRPTARADLPVWRQGDAWLAGGTWLFSEPQAHLTRLIDLADLRWPALCVDEAGLQVAATCTVSELDALSPPPDWRAAPLIDQCCRAFLASFKIWKTATVGGNICMSLPAGPMISLCAALDGVCLVWRAAGDEARVPIIDFVTGDRANGLGEGDILRAIEIPAAALRRRSAFRQISLAPVGRSGALVIGALDAAGGLLLTVSAATTRPIRIVFPGLPEDAELQAGIARAIPDALYHTDVHGAPVWRKAMTARLAAEIRDELREGARA